MNDHSWVFTFLALAPLLWLLVSLGWLRIPALWAGISGLVLTLIIAGNFFNISGDGLFQAAADGVVLALWPIVWAVFGAIYTYNIGVHTGSMDKMKAALSNLSGKETALKLGFNPYWIAATNTTGATAGKMLSPQNIAIAATGVGLIGKEGQILRQTIKICVWYLLGLGVFIYVASYWF